MLFKIHFFFFSFFRRNFQDFRNRGGYGGTARYVQYKRFGPLQVLLNTLDPTITFYSGGGGGFNTMGSMGSSTFNFRASPLPAPATPTPLPQLAEESFTAILRLTEKEGTSLEAESGTLQRAVFNHLVTLDKQVCLF